MTTKLGLAALALWVSLGLWSRAKKPNNPVFPTDDQFPPPRTALMALSNDSAQRVRDSIILDTSALIISVTENTNGQVQKAGNNSHFTLTTNEAGGRATVSTTGGLQGILLFDDGTPEDTKAGDSGYEVDYHIPPEGQVIQAKLRGNLADRVDNLAEPVMPATQITIQKPPDGVSLFPPTPVGAQQNALRLTWKARRDRFFSMELKHAR